MYVVLEAATPFVEKGTISGQKIMVDSGFMALYTSSRLAETGILEAVEKLIRIMVVFFFISLNIGGVFGISSLRVRQS